MSKLVSGRSPPAVIPEGYEWGQTGTRREYVGVERYRQRPEVISPEEYDKRLAAATGQTADRRSGTYKQVKSAQPSRRYVPGQGLVDLGKDFSKNWTERFTPTFGLIPKAAPAAHLGAPGAVAGSSAPPSGGPQPSGPGEPRTEAKSVTPHPVVTSEPVRRRRRLMGSGPGYSFFMTRAEEDKTKKQSLG